MPGDSPSVSGTACASWNHDQEGERRAERCPQSGVEPPGNSGGGLPAQESRPTENAAAAKLQVRPQSATPLRQEPERHAWATPVVVLGTRGRLRLVLVVERCAWGCGRAHVHSGPADFIVGRRKAGCNGKSYTVHSLAQREQAA